MSAAHTPIGPQPPLASRKVAIDVRDLGIRFNLRLTRRTTLRGSVNGLLRRGPRPGHFWALRGLDLRVLHGDSLAIVGPNGAGKSTLLLALAGILEPTEGEIRIDGRVSTLLTLGAGFEWELTGRENIDLVGALMGIEGEVMDELTPGIIEFADIGRFIDAPVRTYSLGMRARLGFSIATAVSPDILLLDEVLGTGDQQFRAKSQARVRELIGRARAIVLVTHDLSYVEEFCNRAVLLEKGTVIKDGDPAEVVELYRERTAQAKLLAEQDAGRFKDFAETEPGTVRSQATPSQR